MPPLAKMLYLRPKYSRSEELQALFSPNWTVLPRAVSIAVKSELDVPIRFIGVGEQVNDLQPFVPEDFVNALFGDDK